MSTPRLDAYGDPLPPFALWRLGTVRWRHRGMTVDDLVFSRDGRTVFAAGSGLTAIDTATGAVRWALPDTGVSNLALLPDPDGDRLVTVGLGGTLAQHDAASGAPRRSTALPTSSLNAVAVSPDRGTVFAGGFQLFGALLEPDGSTRATLPISGGIYVNHAAFSPDGRTLVTTDSSDRVVLWSVADGRRLRTFGAADLSPNCAAFTPDGRRLVVATSEGMIVVFDVATGDTVARWQAHRSSASRVVVAPDGLRAVTAGEDGAVSLWNLSDGAPLATRSASQLGTGLALSPDGATVAHADGPRVALVDLATFAERAPTTEHSDPVQELAVARDGASVATVAGRGEVRWWSLADGRPLATAPLDAYVQGLRALPEADRYAVMPPRDDGTLVIDVVARSLAVGPGTAADAQQAWWGRAAGATLRGGRLTLTNAKGASRTLKAAPAALAITPDDGHAVGLERSDVTAWELAGFGVVATAKVRSAVGFVMSPRGDEIAVWAKAGLHRLGVPDGVERALWKPPPGARVWTAAYSPDGRCIAVATLSDVRIIDVASNMEVALLTGHGALVVAAAFDHDGGRLVTAGWDTTALVWSVAEAMAGHVNPTVPKAAKGGKKTAKG